MVIVKTGVFFTLKEPLKLLAVSYVVVANGDVCGH